MKKSELYEQIEAYLNDTLPPDQRMEWEQRMAEDPALRQEVALHQQLKEDFDPGRIALRAKLRDIMQESLPSNSQSKSDKKWHWWIWLGSLLSTALILFAVWMVWAKEKPASTEPESAPIETPKIYPDTISETPKKPAPIAKADPAHFKPNPSLEAFVNSQVRSESIAIKVSRPINGMTFIPDKKGKISVPFTGIISWPEDHQATEFVLSFFNNQTTSQTVLQVPISGQKEGLDKLKFDFQQPLKLPFGRYYFTIEAADMGEILFAGMFLIVPE